MFTSWWKGLQTIPETLLHVAVAMHLLLVFCSGESDVLREEKDSPLGEDRRLPEVGKVGVQD